MRDTQKTMTFSATSFGGCNRFSPLLIYHPVEGGSFSVFFLLQKNMFFTSFRWLTRMDCHQPCAAPIWRRSFVQVFNHMPFAACCEHHLGGGGVRDGLRLVQVQWWVWGKTMETSNPLVPHSKDIFQVGSSLGEVRVSVRFEYTAFQQDTLIRRWRILGHD